jgi:hypothetical protein
MKVLLSVLSAVVLVASCTGTEQAPTPPDAPSASSSGRRHSVEPIESITDRASFVAALEAAGHTVRPGGVVDLVGFEGLASSGRKVSIDGVRVWALDYATLPSTRSARISARMGMRWATPRFLVAAHLRDREADRGSFGPADTLRTLDKLLGPQFAGV